MLSDKINYIHRYIVGHGRTLWNSFSKLYNYRCSLIGSIDIDPMLSLSLRSKPGAVSEVDQIDLCNYLNRPLYLSIYVCSTVWHVMIAFRAEMQTLFYEGIFGNNCRHVDKGFSYAAMACADPPRASLLRDRMNPWKEGYTKFVALPRVSATVKPRDLLHSIHFQYQRNIKLRISLFSVQRRS